MAFGESPHIGKVVADPYEAIDAIRTALDATDLVVLSLREWEALWEKLDRDKLPDYRPKHSILRPS